MAGLESPRADGDPEGEAHQFSVGELHPRPFVTVIEESFDTGGSQAFINRLGGGHRLLVVHLDNRDHHLVGGDADWPDQAGIVVVGLGHRCHGPSHADAVGAHGRYPGLSVGVQYRDTHGLGVLPAQFEDVAGLNTTDDREGLPTGGTGLTVDDSPHVRPSIHADVPVDVHSGVVHVVLVGAGGHPGPTLQRRVGVDNEVIHPDRTEAPR